jgi:hypothetical protein
MLSLEQNAEASAELHGLNFAFMMHAACDNDPVCKKLTLRTQKPAHFSSDIYARDFEKGEYECELCAWEPRHLRVLLLVWAMERSGMAAGGC